MSNLVSKKINSVLRFVYSDNNSLSVVFYDNHLLMGVMGQFNQNLKELEELSKTSLYSRGNSILIKSSPEKNEIIANYAARMATRITERNAVLIGVSFGGVVVQEMAAFVDLKKLIIISSVKSKNELPKRLRIVRMLKLYRIVPTGLILSAQDLTNYAVGPRSKKRLALYNEYLHVRDKTYLNWAIYNMIILVWICFKNLSYTEVAISN